MAVSIPKANVPNVYTVTFQGALANRDVPPVMPATTGNLRVAVSETTAGGSLGITAGTLAVASGGALDTHAIGVGRY